MVRCVRRGGLPIAVVVALVLAACDTGTTAHVTKPAGASRPAAATLGSAQPYVLYTHCGIDEARIGSRYFEAGAPAQRRTGQPAAALGQSVPARHDDAAVAVQGRVRR